MKKLLMTVTLLLFMILLSSCGSGNKGYEVITTQDFNTKIQNKETFVFVLAATYCGACDSFKADTLDDYDGNTPVYVLYIDNEFPSDQAGYDAQALHSFLDSHSLTPSLYGISDEEFGTPTSYAIQKGIILDVELGYMDKSDFNDFLDNNF